MNLQRGNFKNVIFLYTKLAQIGHRLAAFHQLFSWTSAGPSKCLIDKLIGWQGYSEQQKALSKTIFSK